MDKNRFLLLVNNYSSLTSDETEELISVQREYPYSQAIHTLVASGSNKNNLLGKEQYLHLAAVYATDRATLKSIVTAPIQERMAVTPSGEIKTPVKQQEIAIIESNTSKAIQLGGDDLIDEVFHDLDTLKKLKHDFELAAEEYDKLPGHKTTKSHRLKTEKHVITPLVADGEGESLIEEIKSSKKKIDPSDPKQKEQLEIIDQFIKSKPSIGRNKPSVQSAPADLTESSEVFSDNIVSETLVEILIKQGKKEKAIDVLRKLIWKFPQKKAYFAAQIEELKN